MLPDRWSSTSLSGQWLVSHEGHSQCRVWVGHWEGHRPSLCRVPGHPFLAILHNISLCQCSAPSGFWQLSPLGPCSLGLSPGRWKPLVMMLFSALHYSTWSQEGFQTLASAHVLHLTTSYSCLSTSDAFWGLWGFQKCQKWSRSLEVNL